MVAGTKKERLTPEWILSKGVTSYDIYRKYLGEDFKIGKAIQSPMPGRRDNNPSFIIGNRAGFMYHVDFADSRYKGNAFSFVQQKMMFLNFNDALQQIAKDFGLITNNLGEREKRPIYEQPKEIEKPAFIQVVYSTKFTREEEEYWNQYHLSKEEVIKGDIYHINSYYVNRRRGGLRKGELAFGYLWEGKWKIYRPYACKNRKWISSIPYDAVENLQALKQCKKAIVCKARKDRLILSKFIPTICSVQGESLVALSDDTISFLRTNCEDVYINYDSDPPGVKASWDVTTEYRFKHLNVPYEYLNEGIKDFADLARIKGLQTVENYLKSKSII